MLATNHQTDGSAMRRPLFVGMGLGCFAGLLVLWDGAVNSGPMMAFWILSTPIVSASILVSIWFIRGVASLRGSSNEGRQGGVAAAFVAGTAVFLIVSIAGGWAVAESGLSRRLLSDDALRRTFQRHLPAFRDFEDRWRTSLSSEDGHTLTTELASRVGGSEEPVWETLGGPVYFPYAMEHVLKEMNVKGIAFVPLGFETSSRAGRSLVTAIGERWFIYLEGK